MECDDPARFCTKEEARRVASRSACHARSLTCQQDRWVNSRMEMLAEPRGHTVKTPKLPNQRGPLLLCCLLGIATSCPAIDAADQPQWGERFSRNMISAETGLPESFDPATGRNVRWSAPMGRSYATPVVAQGRVLIGCNNEPPRDPRHQGDRGVLVCLDEADGRLLWQLVVPKFQGDIYLDWPGAGMCSPATVEGDRVYMVTNRAEVVCLDLHGLANGNDGPYQDEGQHLVLPGEEPMEVGPLDADILWLFDMPSQAGMYPHDSAQAPSCCTATTCI